MPYGVDKELGGDSPANVKFMERCTKRVMMENKGYSKGRAIAICKKALRNKHSKKGGE